MTSRVLLDDALIEEAMRATGLKTKREAVELGLKALIRLARQAEARKLRGQLPWHGDLEAMRTDDWSRAAKSFCDVPRASE